MGILSSTRNQTQDTFTLTEGPVTISYPSTLSEPSLKDLRDYLEIFMRKVERIGHDPHDVVQPHVTTPQLFPTKEASSTIKVP